MTTLLLIAIWLGLGWVGYLLTRWWWTSTLDWTTGERTFALLYVPFGPLNLLTGVLLAASSLAISDGERVLKERRR